VPWPFRRNPLKSPFAQDLLDVRSDWEDRVARYPDIEEANRLAILSASASATVVLGGLGAVWIERFSDAEATPTKPDGSEKPDRTADSSQNVRTPGSESSPSWTRIVRAGRRRLIRPWRTMQS
jgi:hypothetical protein